MSDDQVTKDSKSDTPDTLTKVSPRNAGEALGLIVLALRDFCEKYPDAPLVAIRNLRSAIDDLLT